MKVSTFRLSAPKKITALAFITMLIFLAAMACDFYTLFSWEGLTTYNRVGVVWRLVTSFIMLVVLIGYLCASRYRVSAKSVIFFLGILPITRIKKEKVTELRVLNQSQKLLLFFGNAYCRIIIKSESFSAFADALKEKEYEFTYQYDYEE
ncbi:MAG: hypothetical protein E7363_06235 [Clostridiales bacterium]|nr:hypothetical protein [Clostridiales bacterium]